MYNQRILFTIMFAIHYRVTYAEITIRYYCAISKSRREHKHNACDAIYVYVNILVSTNTPFLVTPISSLISIMSFLPFQILHLYCCRAWCAGMQGSGAWLLIWGEWESPPPSWKVRVFHSSSVDTRIVPIHKMTIPGRSSQARKRMSKIPPSEKIGNANSGLCHRCMWMEERRKSAPRYQSPCIFVHQCSYNIDFCV